MLATRTSDLEAFRTRVREVVDRHPVVVDNAYTRWFATGQATLDIAQGRLADVVEHLRDIPEVIEAHGTTGPGDLHCRVVARTNDHLQQVINRMLEVQGINRTTTVIALSEQIPSRVLPLVDAAVEPNGGSTVQAGL